MASFSRKTGIIGALVIAGVLIAGSIFISSNGLALFAPGTANAASTQALLQAYATKDSDNDGLPDWEESLYGLDLNNAHSFSPNETDGQAVAEGLVKPKFLTQAPASASASTTDANLPDGILPAPGSLTEQFSQALFTEYINQSTSNGATLSDDDIAPLAEGAMQSFAQNHKQQDIYSSSEEQLVAGGPVALTAYAVAAQNAYGDNTNATDETGIEYFSDVVEKNDTQDLKQIAAIGSQYTAISHALMQTSVPTEAQYAHLEMTNALADLGSDFTDMSMMTTDPLRAYLGLADYQVDAAALTKSFVDMGSVFKSEQVTIAPNDPGYDFFTMSLTAVQPAATP